MAEEITKFPALHIPTEHQSAPREHWADREIKKAAEEIDSGRFVPDTSDEKLQAAQNLGLSLGLGHEPAAIGQKPALEDFRATHDATGALAQHPRVIEALEKMKHETVELKGHQLIEMNAALRELTAAKEAKHRWDGQGRWMGHDNEEMRYGRIMPPWQFFKRLKRFARRHMKLSERIEFPSDHQRSGISGIYMKNPRYDGQIRVTCNERRKEALEAADACTKKWQIVQSLHKSGRTGEAEKLLKELTAEVAEARAIYDQAMIVELNAEPEYLRVATVQWPLSTEWMVMDFTEWGTVYKPRFYGWRTALLTMIRCGAITEAEAHKAFPPGKGEADRWYLEQIYNFKLEGPIQ